VQSTRGVGTTVTISLPRAWPPATLEPPARPRSPAVSRLRVLIVEDEPPIARALERLLGRHSVVRADDGGAALALLEARADFDLVLCDLMMPRVSGADLYARVAERWPALARRFVIMTGGALTPDSREFLARFPGPVLGKPFTPEAVASCIESAAAPASEPKPGETRS